MSQRGRDFKYAKMWSHCLKYLLMNSSNKVKKPRKPQKVKESRNGGAMNVCAASLVEVTQ